MDMDPNQLFLMEEAAPSYLQQTIPGLMAPLTTGGASRLAAAAEPGSVYASPIAGTPSPDISPLASLGLQNYGIGGVLAGSIGNSYLSSMMQQQGLLPMGNAGSYMQAYRTRNMMNMRQQVAKQVAGQDAEGYYRTMRGAAALAGMPFDRAQQQAARRMADSFAEMGPTLGAVAPGLLDALAGERGSVQALSAQMMDANRYRLDPTSGRMGYAAEANADMVNGVFNTMFAEDNMAQMQGMRAGDVGQMYRTLTAEGMVGTRGSLRERTIRTLQQTRDEGASLKTLGDSAGVAMEDTTNLESLSNADLTKLRQTAGVKTRLTQSDTRQITDQLQGYVSSLAAMREVFGENGDPNAPVPKLVNALKSLTSNQMHRFDAKELNTMVRDMQSLSQMSGKSMDQLFAMTETANVINTGTLGRNGSQFNQTATNVGVTTGMAFGERGAATGFGAISREEAEQASMRLFSRGMASEMGNAMGALSRVERAGGFADNGAGRQMKAILAASDIGAKTYTYIDDTGQSRTAEVPTKEMDFLAIAKRGAIEGMDAGGFAMMLGDRTSNQRALANDPERQQAAFRQQGNEIDKEIARVTANRISYSQPLRDQIQDPRLRSAAAFAISKASTDALSGLTQEQLQNEAVRNKALSDAMTVAASNYGVTLTEAEASNMAASNFGQAEGVVKRFGFDSFTGKQAVLSPAMTAARTEQQAIAASRAGVNEAMAQLGPKGSFMTRLVTAMQKQGDRGQTADINTLLGDMFAGDMDMDASKLSQPMLDIKERNERIEKLTAQIQGASPEVVQNLRKDIKEQTAKLQEATQNTHKLAREMGLVPEEGKFNLADISQGRQAANELDAIGQSARVRTMATSSAVSDADRLAASGSKLSANDMQVLAAVRRQDQLANVDQAAAMPVDIMNDKNRAFYDERIREGATPDGARELLRQELRNNVGDMAEQTKDIGRLFGKTTVGKLSQAQQDAVIRGRRAGLELIPTDDETTKRSQLLRPAGQAVLTAAERDALPADERAAYIEQERSLTRAAETQLMAEKQLQALGQLAPGQTLTGDAAALDKYKGLDAGLRARLQAAAPADRAKVVDSYLDQEQRNKFLADPTKARDQAMSFSQTDEGKRAASATEQNIDTLSDIRKEYIQDTQAFSRGGVRGQLAVEQNKKAETDLQLLANKYFDGNVGRMLVSQGRAMSDEGLAEAEAEFQALGQDPAAQAQVADRLKSAGVAVADPTQLTSAQYQVFVGLQAKDAEQSMRSSVDAMRGGATQTYADMLSPTDSTRALAQKLMGGKATEARTGGLQALSSAALLQGVDLEKTVDKLDLTKITQQMAAGKAVDTRGMTPEQQELIKTAEQMQSLTTLSREQLSSLESVDRLSTQGAKQGAAALGISEAEYTQIVKSGKSEENLRLFQTKDELKAAQQDDTRLSGLKMSLAQKENMLAKGRGSTQLPAEIRQKRHEMEMAQARKDKRMWEAGLNPSDPADVEKYNKRLVGQGQVEKLYEQSADYQKEREKLIATGIDPVEADKQLATIHKLSEKGAEQSRKAAASDLGSDSLNTLADAFGKTEADDRTKFRQMVGARGGNTERNNALVASAIQELHLDDPKKMGAGMTAIEKLDKLTDDFRNDKTPAGRKKLADSLGVDVETLESGMRKTKFLGLDKKDEKYTDMDYESALKAKSGVDVSKEVKSEEDRTLRITGGTVEVRGDITGQMTVHEMVAVGGSR